MTDFILINRITLYEYNLLMKGVMLKKLDEKAERHEKAWLSRVVNAEKKVGKDKTEYVFKKYTDFFDYEKEYSNLFEKKEDKMSDFKKLVLEANKEV